MKKLIYDNPLACPADIADFILEGNEGSLVTDFTSGQMQMKSGLPAALEQAANYVFWCPEVFPENIEIEWDFSPLSDIGLCIMFFAATGSKGEDLFDLSLAARKGHYGSYHSGDINAYHISYCRRRYPEERAFRTCNLRKSYGFHLLDIAGDPLPNVADATSPYHIKIVKNNGVIDFLINDMPVLHADDSENPWGVGRVGFRQMSPMVAEYANLKVYEIIDDM